MIVITLRTGQTLQFPDGTSQDVIERAKQRVLAGEFDSRPEPDTRSSGPGLDLSRLRNQREPGTYDLSHIEQPRREIQGPPRPIQGPPDFREWQPDPKSPMRERRSTGGGWEYRPRAGAMGTAPVAVGRVEGGTPERSPARRAIDASAAQGAPGFRTLATGLDLAETIPEALGVAGTTALDANVQVANVGRLPLVAAEGLVRRAARPLEEAAGRPLLDPSPAVPDPLGSVVARTTELREDATRDLAEGSQHLPTPIAAGVFHAATTAGLLADASNLIGGEAKPFGTGGRAMTELEQAAAARSGKYLPGAEEPLIYFDRRPPSPGFKGRIPDGYRELRGKPWREYPDAAAMEAGEYSTIPLDKPKGPDPRPRSMDRDPLPVRLVGGSSDEARDRIYGLWDYASRRYPRIAGTVEELHISPPGTGGWYGGPQGHLVLAEDADLGMLMHELTHRGQAARGQFGAGLDESAPVRRGDVYSRIPEPPARPYPKEPLPGLPAGDVDSSLIDEAWSRVAARYPKLTSRITEIQHGDSLSLLPTDNGITLTVPVGRAVTAPELASQLETAALHSRAYGLPLDDSLVHQEVIDALRDTGGKSFETPGGKWGRIPGSDGGDLGRTQPTGITNVFHQNPTQEIRDRFPDAMIDSKDAYPGPVYTGPERRMRPFTQAQIDSEVDRILDPKLDDGLDPEWEAGQRGLAAFEAENPRIEAQSYNGIPYVSRSGEVPPHVVKQWDDHVRQSMSDRGLATVSEFPAPRPAPAYTFGDMIDEAGDLPVIDGNPRPRLVPTEAEQAARLEAAEREAFTRPPLAFKPSERGSIGAPPDPITPPTVPFQVKLPEEYVAERLGWKVPDGPPRVTQPVDTLTTPDFQTNLAAQVGGPESGYFGDPEIAGYVMERSDEVFKAIGPPQSWDTLEEMATRLGTTKDEFLSRPSHWNVLPPEARLRLTYVIKGNEQDIASIQSKLVAGTATDADKAELLRHINTREDLIKLGAQAGSAYGRALNSLKMEARLALTDDVLLRQKLYKEYSKQLDAEKPLMETLARLDPNNPEELQAFLRHVNKPRWHEYAQEYWVSSILSGLATHERNLIGNSVNAVLENAVVRPASAMFDAARVAGTGADRAIYLRETHEAMKGLAKGAYKATLKPFVDETQQAVAAVGLTRGLRQGIRKGFEVLKRGYDPLTMQGKLLPVRSAFARSQNRVVREVVGPIVTAPLRLLQVSDTLFKTMNHTAEIYAQAARTASKEGLSGDGFATRVANLIQNPTPEMIDAADAFALKATFNDDASAIGKAVMGLRDLPGASSTNPGLQAGLDTYRAGMGFILPFVKIADRLMVRGFEYTPLGIPMAVGARRAGNFAEAADLAARSSIGSVVLAYAASLAMEGRLTAGAPTDEGEKAAFYGAQKQPWSVRTDDGVWIPYGGLQPIGTPFAIAAAAWKGWKESDEAPDIEKLGHAAQQIGVYVTDQSYMEGLSKFMDAIGGTDAQSGRAFSDLATNTTWGFVPYSGMTRSIARGIDPRVIDAETIEQRLKQNVPGASLSMDARLTPWGEDVVPVGGRLRSVLAPGSILLPSQEKSNPLDQELERLGTPIGYVGKSIADKLPEGKSLGTWKLNQHEWNMYQRVAGRTTKMILEMRFSDPAYQNWDIESQRDEVGKLIEAARKYARIQMVRHRRGQYKSVDVTPTWSEYAVEMQPEMPNLY